MIFKRIFLPILKLTLQKDRWIALSLACPMCVLCSSVMHTSVPLPCVLPTQDLVELILLVKSCFLPHGVCLIFLLALPKYQPPLRNGFCLLPTEAGVHMRFYKWKSERTMYIWSSLYYYVWAEEWLDPNNALGKWKWQRSRDFSPAIS